MKLLIPTLCCLISHSVIAQSSYWQQELRYTIQAQLNETEKSITATETIVYKNNSPQTLDYIWFHIWPNAYKHDSTALMMQIKGDSSRAEKLTTAGHGWIEALAFKVNDVPARTEPHPNLQYIDIIRLVLNEPLPPGDSITISTPFKVVLPPYFSRSGYAGTEIMACQWYPKPAVYDAAGWHEFPYLDMGEFYSEYGDYNVTLTVPADGVVSATGTLDTKDELERYKNIGARNARRRKKKPTHYVPAPGANTKTLVYHAEHVPDFAWFVDTDFVIQYDTIHLAGGRVVDAFSYYHPKKKTVWNNSIDYIKDAVKKYSSWIGEYEYPTVQAVEGPENNSSGGMEYPMTTLITSPDALPESLDGVITHEVGHNWFMSMLGTNERAHTWMDEGLNTFFEFRYEAEKYRYNSIFGKSIPAAVRRLTADKFLALIYNAIHQQLPMEAPMDLPADQFHDSDEYALVAYIKTALWMYIMESTLGKEKFDLAVKNYFNKWKDKHPQPEDMQAAFEEATGRNLDALFELTKKEGKFQITFK